MSEIQRSNCIRTPFLLESAAFWGHADMSLAHSLQNGRNSFLKIGATYKSAPSDAASPETVVQKPEASPRVSESLCSYRTQAFWLSALLIPGMLFPLLCSIPELLCIGGRRLATARHAITPPLSPCRSAAARLPHRAASLRSCVDGTPAPAPPWKS